MNNYVSITLVSTAFALVCGFTTSCDKQQQKSILSNNKITEIGFKEVKTPEEAIQRLKEGNSRFVTDSCINENQGKKRINETSSKQSPFAVVVGCSDSRVPVELIFDQGIGELFVVRTAGNSVNNDYVMGSVDYAVNHLGVKTIVVLGHGGCGGVIGAITEATKGDEHKNGKVHHVIQTIREDVKHYVGKSDSLTAAIHTNAAAQVERIKTYPHIQKLIKEGKLSVIKAYYSINSGAVTFI